MSDAPAPSTETAPVPAAEPAPPTTEAHPGDLKTAEAAGDYSLWQKQREAREQLLNKAISVLDNALDGNLPDSEHSKLRVTAALAIVTRGY